MPIESYVVNRENIADVYKDKNALNVDIRDAMEKDFDKAVKQWIGHGKIFKGKTEKESANLIWLFLRNHCKYRRDPESNQIIRLPSYFVRSRPRYGDCKTFAMFARSAFAALYPNNETAFRFAGYRDPNGNPTHVYTVVKNSAGDEIIIDGCYPHFNAEKKYSLALPLNYKSMRVTTLSGTSSDTLTSINEKACPKKRHRIKELAKLRRQMNLARAEYDGGHISKATFTSRLNSIEQAIPLADDNTVGKLSKEERKKRRKRFNEKIKKGWKKFGKGLGFGLALVNLAPVRGAFLSLVAMNLNGLASNMKLVYDDKKDREGWNRIKKFWTHVGGFEKILVKAMKAGAGHKPLWFSKKSKARYQARVDSLKKAGRISGLGFLEGGTILGEHIQGIGIAPAVAAAVLAMGSTLLAGIIPLVMKALKGKGTPQAQEAQAVLQEQGQEIVSQTKAGQGYQKAFVDDMGVNKDQAEQQAQQEEQQAVETNEEQGGNIEGLGKLDGATQADLFSSLNTILGKGLEFAGNVVERKLKKNPAAKKRLEETANADEYYANQNATNLGYKDRVKYAPIPRKTASGGVMKYLPWAVGGVAVIAAIIAFATRGGNKK